MLPALTLVLGGARSGKSAYAESLMATATGPIYLATAEAADDEMNARIRSHQRRRGPAWTTVEEPVDLVGALALHSRPGQPILVDCLTLWLSNVMLAGLAVDEAIDRLVEALPAMPGPLVLVANEVGLGIVPDNALARAFRDHAGRLNQAVAARAHRVLFIAAGLPLFLKDLK
ncbi:MAG TPA: bifunctional adenosylcobinamide kinase/adenosylcobinamide-phosphate guanylyltransferase [Rhodospirillaceae bacterium]|nr:bifunctional adenosylcobinamide kinase/adenosylcobinamide-phosphate guanylyltransferase [Rhodospirillaceae bacterium]